jgi:hypothetical protein
LQKSGFTTIFQKFLAEENAYISICQREEQDRKIFLCKSYKKVVNFSKNAFKFFSPLIDWHWWRFFIGKMDGENLWEKKFGEAKTSTLKTPIKILKSKKGQQHHLQKLLKQFTDTLWLIFAAPIFNERLLHAVTFQRYSHIG